MSEIIRNESNNKYNQTHDKDDSKEWLNKWGYSSKAPNFPHYSSFEVRLSSYDSWPETMKVTPQALSEAGFFYLGQEDRTICFHCGGGLNEWKEFDEPWVEHAFWFPNCHYVLSVKGKEYVNGALNRRQEAISLRKSKNSPNYLSLAIKEIRLSEKKSTSPKSKEVDGSIKSQSIEELKESPMLCNICYLRDKNILFLPCKHIVACTLCTSKLTKCAVCRTPISDTIEVFL